MERDRPKAYWHRLQQPARELTYDHVSVFLHLSEGPKPRSLTLARHQAHETHPFGPAHSFCANG